MVWKCNQKEKENSQQHEYPCCAEASIEGVGTFSVLDVVCFVPIPFLGKMKFVDFRGFNFDSRMT
ncbi:hypothetical protein CsSME_00051449 [Camellia sinensis var. sinensis]